MIPSSTVLVLSKNEFKRLSEDKMNLQQSEVVQVDIFHSYSHFSKMDSLFVSLDLVLLI